MQEEILLYIIYYYMIYKKYHLELIINKNLSINE